MTTLHLVFKTHLDIGFTDYAANVVQTYFKKFIPEAVALAAQTHDQPQQFRWTTGAWLIYEYLEQANAAERAAMEHAIEAGDIHWHALPFTTHTELIDESLWRFGLSLSHKLDQRFGRQTIAAKLTDVPGHTRALVPLLAEAGVRLLHIGVNEASTVPDVPAAFVWRDEHTQTEVMVIYHEAYGGVTSVAGLDDALALVFTGDNQGPPSTSMVSEAYQSLEANNPGASVIASTLDDFASQLETVRGSLPIIKSEIGDTWIHGAGTDPTKLSRYRELARLRREWLTRPLSSEDQQRIERFSRSLILVPEHTWGMDEKTHLPDHTHYLPVDLAALRQTEAAQRFAASWAEQRAYIDTALTALDGSPLAAEAHDRLAALIPQPPSVDQSSTPTSITLQNSRFTLQFNAATGAIERLTDRQTSTEWADAAHPLALFRYELFGQEDYDRHWEQYNRNRDNPEVVAWGIEDFTKPGIPVAEHAVWLPSVMSAHQPSETRTIFALALPAEAGEFGAPARLSLAYTLHDDRIEVVLQWFSKPANRLPEAFWLSFQPITNDENGWRFEKIGQMIDPRDVVSKGARTLHAIDQHLIYTDGEHSFELETLDAVLVAPGQPSLLNFHNQLPDLRGGVHVNLYNNVWGTNFPMWFDDDARFRFNLRFT